MLQGLKQDACQPQNLVFTGIRVVSDALQCAGGIALAPNWCKTGWQPLFGNLAH
jgi:hypothetical protein